MNYLKELKDEIKEVLAKDNLANIVISNTGFSAAFYEKVEKPVKAETKKTKAKAETSALDKLYESPPSQEDIEAELEERNRKLREKFNNQGNVIPTDGVAAWAGDEE